MRGISSKILRSSKGKSCLNLILLILLGLLVFYPSLNNGFVWDDEEQIVNNQIIKTGSIKTIFSGGAFNSGGMEKLTGAYYKPLMTLSFSIIYKLFNLNSFYFHLFQVSLHLINTILVFILLNKFSKSKKIILNTLLSAIFLVHPLISENAFYLANLQDNLYILFGLIYFNILLFWNRSKLSFFFLILIGFLSLLSKESAILFTLASIFYTFLMDKKNLPRVFVTWTLSILVYLCLRLWFAGIGFSTGNINPMFYLGLIDRLKNIPNILFTALLSLIFPSSKSLTINQQWVIKNFDFSNLYLPIIILVILFTWLFAYFIKSRNKLFLFFLFCFVIGLGLHSQLMPIDVTFSGRWFVFSLIGLLGMISTLLTENYTSHLVLFLIVLVFSAITLNRGYDFKSGLTLYTHDAKYENDNYNLENNLGVEFYRIGKRDEAKIRFENSIKLNPNWWVAYNNLGAYYEFVNRQDLAGLYYLKSIEKGDYYLAVENYAMLLYKQKKNDELKKFLDTYLKLLPQNKTLTELYLEFPQ